MQNGILEYYCAGIVLFYIRDAAVEIYICVHVAVFHFLRSRGTLFFLHAAAYHLPLLLTYKSTAQTPKLAAWHIAKDSEKWEKSDGYQIGIIQYGYLYIVITNIAVCISYMQELSYILGQ
jgi:hypothetical protein